MPGPTPTDLYTAENQTLNNASKTLKDIIIEFGVQQPVPNPDLLENQSGSRNRTSFTYKDTETEQFWFHPDHLLTQFVVVLSVREPPSSV